MFCLFVTANLIKREILENGYRRTENKFELETLKKVERIRISRSLYANKIVLCKCEEQ